MFHYHLPLIKDLQFGAAGSPKCIDIIIPRLEAGGQSIKPIGECETDDEINALTLTDLTIESLQRLGKPFRLWEWRGPERGLKLLKCSNDELGTNIDPKNDAMFIILATAKTGAAKLFEVDGAFEGLFELDEKHEKKKSRYAWEKLISKERQKALQEKKIDNVYMGAIFVEREESKYLQGIINAEQENKLVFGRCTISKKKIVGIFKTSRSISVIN